MTRPSITFAALALFTLLIMAFLLAPTFLISWASFGRAETLSVPPGDYTLHWHERLFEDWQWRRALSNSVQVAIIAALLSIAASITAAFALLSVQQPWRGVLFTLFLIPLLFPSVSLAVGQLGVFALLRIPESTLRLALAHLAICLPLAFLVASLALFGPNRKHFERALSLTDSRAYIFSRVVAPLASTQLLGAGLIAFLFSFDEPVLSQFLAGPNTETIPRRIFNGIRFELDPTAAAVTFIVFVAWIATTLLFLAANQKASREQR